MIPVLARYTHQLNENMKLMEVKWVTRQLQFGTKNQPLIIRLLLTVK